MVDSPASTWRRPLSQSERMPLRRATSAIWSAMAPCPIRRSISLVTVSTCMMLNRPR